MKQIITLVGVLFCVLNAFAIESIQTNYSIIKVRSAVNSGNSYIIADSYEGTIVALGYDGTVLWENKLSGYMNHDVWCEDITGDDNDEILCANADGNVYCLSRTGELLWQFKKTTAPMLSVCVVHDANNKAYVVCGGFDKYLYYLDSNGQLVKSVHSTKYSQSKYWGGGNIDNLDGHSVSNFIRKVPFTDGKEKLLVHSVNQHIDQGKLYQFQPLSESADKVHSVSEDAINIFMGSMRVCDPDKDGNYEVLTGGSGGYKSDRWGSYDPATGQFKSFDIAGYISSVSKIRFGYRSAIVDYFSQGDSYNYIVLYAEQILVIPPDLNPANTELLTSKYAYLDMWHDVKTNRILLSGTQDGGNCIHIIDPESQSWKSEFEALTPPGKMTEIEENVSIVRNKLSSFKTPSYERKPLPVYMISGGQDDPLAKDLMINSRSPKWLKDREPMPRQERSWRSAIDNQFFRERLDGRMSYTKTPEEIEKLVIPEFENNFGIHFWGGHGNDPYYYQHSTYNKIVNAGKGKPSVFFWPEIYGGDPQYQFLLEDLFLPLGEYAGDKNGKVYFRSKAPMWSFVVHLPHWETVRNGYCADAFVAAHEETGAKIAELSIPGRYGLWASGAVNDLGARAVPDMMRFHGMRTNCEPISGSAYLRYSIYNIASGSRYVNNMGGRLSSLLWELIGKGALYVPKREEIVSFSPVHLGMKAVDTDIINDVNKLKWNIFYNESWENSTPRVFSRMNDSWPGAPVTDWDFSRYAAGTKDRRTHFLPPYENGLVLIAPVQQGVFAEESVPRGKLTDHLHPIYKNMSQEFVTDGKYYFSDSGTKYNANEYYTNVEQAIKNGADMLPLTVKGGVAWVCAESAPKHLRLTLVDGGFLNPSKKQALVTFHTVTPVKVTDVLSGEQLAVGDNIQIDVPCGMFRFIDIEIAEPLSGENIEPAFTDKNGIIEKADAFINAIYNDTISKDVIDPDKDDLLTFEKLTGPSWLKVNKDGSLTGVPDKSDIGLNVFNVRAIDLQGKYDDAMITIQVTPNLSTTELINPIEDAFVRAGKYADENYGSSESLDCKADYTYVDYMRNVFLKFDLHSIGMNPESVGHAILRLNVASNNDIGETQYAIAIDDDSWTEESITWNTQPEKGLTQDTIVTKAVGSWSEFDITSHLLNELNKDSILSVMVLADERIHTTYFSSEAAEDNRPQLLIVGKTGIGNSAPSWSVLNLIRDEAFENTAYSADIINEATDPDNDRLFYFIVDGPKWLKMDTDGKISGTPDHQSIGLNHWTVKVADGVNEPQLASLDILVKEVISTGLKEDPQESITKVYPNPAKNFLYVETGGSRVVNLKLFGLNGNVIENRMFKNRTIIQTSGFKPGIYVLKVLTDSGIESFKVVVL